MKFLSLDTETTGLNPRVHSLISVGAVVADIFDEEAKTYEYHAYLWREDMIWSNFCLRLHYNLMDTILFRLVNGKAVQDGKPVIFQDSKDLEKDFLRWLSFVHDETGVNPAGKNYGTFDYGFLDGIGLAKHFRKRALDPAQLFVTRGDTKLPDLKECKQRAIDLGCDKFASAHVKHDALADAWDVVHLLQFGYANDCIGFRVNRTR